jgi:phage anti-repressor protein
MSNNSLIPIFAGEIAGNSAQLVDARLLHSFLESKQEFTNWIKKRIAHYKFTQGVDFSVIDNFIGDASAFGGKRKVIDYHLTLDMAKELSMVERNDKGKQARRYFIECENKLYAQSQPQSQPQPTKLENYLAQAENNPLLEMLSNDNDVGLLKWTLSILTDSSKLISAYEGSGDVVRELSTRQINSLRKLIDNEKYQMIVQILEHRLIELCSSYELQNQQLLQAQQEIQALSLENQVLLKDKYVPLLEKYTVLLEKQHKEA